MTYTKLANSILTSTLWMEDDKTRLVWIALLAMSDKNGEVQASIPGLANIARVSVEACRTAIATLMAPDPDSRTKTDDGRRLEAIQGGWLLINHADYRRLASDDDRREKAAIRQKRAREKAKIVTLPSRSACDKSHQNSQAEADTEEEKEKDMQPSAAGFEEFWKSWPKNSRKGGKAECEKLWKSQKLEAMANDIVAHVKAMTATDDWAKEGGKYIPAPLVYIRQKRWDGSELANGGSCDQFAGAI